MAEERPFLTAHWRHLAMLNYEIDPSVLAPRVPHGSELDAFGGRTFVSVVGFRFLGTRVWGVPIPGHRDFEELNLRFYVRREAAGELRRGVVFVKEVVPRAAIAWVARRLYNENYVSLPMRHRDQVGDRASARMEIGWRHAGREESLSLRVSGEPSLPDDDAEESFITEHYWGYVRQRDGATLEYRVTHPRWPVWRADEAKLECDVASLYGEDFAPFLAAPPTSAFLAVGSEVAVYRGTRIA